MIVNDVIEAYLRHCEREDVHCQEAAAECRRVLLAFAKTPALAERMQTAPATESVMASPVAAATYGEMLVSRCKPWMLADWVEGNPRWKSVATRRLKANIVRACFNWAFEGERIERHPFRSVRFRKPERRPDLKDADFEAICRIANKHYERVLRFLRLTGCRISELCNAVWADFDLEAGIWTIPRHKGRKRTGKAKRVALVAAARVHIEAIAAAAATREVTREAHISVAGFRVPAQAPVFTNSRGRRWNRRWLGQYLIRLKKRHGLKIEASLHGIRHRFGSAGVAAGGNIKLISKQLGHASVRTTEEFYCDLDGEMRAVCAAAELAVARTPAVFPDALTVPAVPAKLGDPGLGALGLRGITAVDSNGRPLARACYPPGKPGR